MILFKTIEPFREYLEKASLHNKKIGFVPTMGALHPGHLSLVQASKQATDITVCSIFVNPTQFNDPRDFEKYPITIEQDILLLEKQGCDVLFLPSVQEIYPGGTTGGKVYQLGYLETILEGSFRPGHFQGVCQVVERLFTIVQPDLAFFGQKDYQQCMVIRKLLELTGLDKTITIHIIPTLRETSGLAMSSRNMRLSEEDKQRATAIYQALLYIQQHLAKESIPTLIAKTQAQLLQAGFEKIDYVAIANADTLEPVESWNGKTSLVALVAAFLGGVRLIDNLVL